MKQKSDKSTMTVGEAGRLGGEKVSKKYGHEFYVAIGKKGGDATKASVAPDHYQKIGSMGGKKGGDATKAKHGQGFYERIGSQGGQKVKALIEAGKKARDATTSTNPA
jgi:general stress protein YciG